MKGNTMNKKLMALALIACLAEQGVALAENVITETSSECCPVVQPSCDPCNVGSRWRPFRARPYRSGCCPTRSYRPRRVRACRPKRGCCPRVKCCRPKPACCPAPAPVCEAPACVKGESYVAADSYVEEAPAATQPAVEAAPETVVEEVAEEVL